MSSILDALKKVERESITDPGEKTPWPAPQSPRPLNRKRTRPWWLTLAIVVGLCAWGTIFWKTRQPETTMPGGAVKPAMPVNQVKNRAPQPTEKHSGPLVPVTQKSQQSPPKARVADSQGQAAQKAHGPGHQTTAPMAGVLPGNLVKLPSRAEDVNIAPPVQPPSMALKETLPPTAIAKSEAENASPSAPNRSFANSAEVIGQPETQQAETDKRFRNDPRIELQALVWAPDAAARFVVINNRLIREGGAMDNIVVVRIDQDDVLLAEGSERWYEKFNIR